MVGQMFMGWRAFLACMLEATLYDLCKKQNAVTVYPISGESEIMPQRVQLVIHRVDLEDILCRMHNDARVNHKFSTIYKTDDLEVTPEQMYVALFDIIVSIQTKGYLDDIYTIDCDFKANHQFVSPTASIPAQTPTKAPVKVVKKTVKVESLTSKLTRIGKTASKYKYRRHTYSTASGMVKHGYGDCWAMAQYLCQQMTKNGIKARVRQGVTKYSNAHRWAEYYSNGKWYPFPYKKTGIDSMFGYTSSVNHVFTRSGC